MKAMRWMLSRFSALIVVLGALAAVPAQAASSGSYQMEVLINGVPAREYYQRGKTYIEAKRGREYSIRLTNLTGERVAAALSVDGLNSIDARHTSAVAARKWILGPYESIVIDGWQTSSSTSRQFYFTGESSSYGAWLGNTRDLGNISAAFFREVRPVPRPYYEPEEEWKDAPRGQSSRENAGTGADRLAKRAAPAAPSASNAPAAESMSGRAKQESSGLRADTADELAATGIGRERDHQVYTVAFRQESSPAAVLTLRYEFRDKLIEMGILPRRWRPDPMSRRETSSGFTDYGFAPDPYSAR